MGSLLKKLKRGFQNNKSQRCQTNNNLFVETLEPRLLLNIDGSFYATSCSAILPAVSENFYAADYIIDGPQEYQTTGYKWPQPGGLGDPITITYSYSNFLDGGIKSSLDVSLGTPLLRSVIEESLGLWAQYAPLNFVEVADSGPLPTSSHISYPAGSHPDIRLGHHYIDGNDSIVSDILGHAFPPTDDGLGGDLHFDNGNFWLVGNLDFSDVVDILEVATHEIGHTLGMGHETFDTAIMNEYYGGWFDGLGTAYLFTDDINGIQSIYGSGVGSVTPLTDFIAKDVWVTTEDRDEKITTARKLL